MEQRKLMELVYAEVSNKFVTKTDGVTKYSKFQYSLNTYVMPEHFGTPQTKRGKTNFIYNPTTIERNKRFTGDLSKAIEDFDASINATIKHFRNAGIRPTKNQFKERLELITERKNGVVEDVTLASYIAKRLEYYNSIIGTGMPDAKKENTIENLHSLFVAVRNYDKARLTSITFNNLKELYWDFWDVMDAIVRGTIIVELEEGEKKKVTNVHGIATNTIINYQHELRQVCYDAVKEGISVSLSYENNKRLILKTQKSSRQYDVNNSDLLTIYRHQPTSDRLQKAKDYIVFSSLTGMRMQSVLELIGEPIKTYAKNNIRFDYVHTIQSKTNTSCFTPLFAPAKEILVRHGGVLNFSVNNATINKQIKDLYVEAGITYGVPVSKHYYKDGLVITDLSVAKIVSSHATRKGFVTNLFELGVDTSISKLVTHPDSKEFGTTDAYKKSTDIMRAIRFFNSVNKHIEHNELYKF
ncbi:hypothetical protein FLACOL7796_00423 [Flavobacterium collinsii]|uniref:Phage integrase SAM-like domain-containing protein n=2 Tax=Flavobacterium collinsii TaxID=1114861 RepID=A0ABM8KDT7_9FLAO|nr:hypothetical protein FLACOL7796_00423 [Flavobacterium collinsii]